MKLLLLIGMLAVGSVFLLPVQKDLAGTWVLDTSGGKSESAILRIQMSEGYFDGKLDIPDQQLYDRPVTIEMKNGKVIILLDSKGSCFIEGVVRDSLFTGRSVVGGASTSVKFYRVKS